MTGGVDWLTVTRADRFRIEKAQELAFALTAVELSMGMYGKPWHQSGYDGFACGHVQYGERTDGCIVRLGSIRSEEHTSELQSLRHLVCRLLLGNKKSCLIPVASMHIPAFLWTKSAL